MNTVMENNIAFSALCNYINTRPLINNSEDEFKLYVNHQPGWAIGFSILSKSIFGRKYSDYLKQWIVDYKPNMLEDVLTSSCDERASFFYLKYFRQWAIEIRRAEAAASIDLIKMDVNLKLLKAYRFECAIWERLNKWRFESLKKRGLSFQELVMALQDAELNFNYGNSLRLFFALDYIMEKHGGENKFEYIELLREYTSWLGSNRRNLRDCM